MGKPNPYKAGVFGDDVSLEGDSDDDLFVEEMADEKLNGVVVDMVR
jgi:hypothetical protein